MTNTPQAEPGTRVFVSDRYFIAPHDHHWCVWDVTNPLRPVEAFASMSAARLSAESMALTDGNERGTDGGD